MKKQMGVIAVLCVAATVFAVPDIEFSPGGSVPGNWIYTGLTPSSGVFRFTQQIDIDAIQGGTADALFNQFVFLPDLTLSNYVSAFPGMGAGVVTAGGPVEIKDGLGNVLVSGTLAEGNYYAVFATSVIYPEGSDVVLDIQINYINNTIGSAYLDTLKVGNYFDLNLSLQWSANFDTMIQKASTGQNGFSGSLSYAVPEPATMLLLAAGGLLLRKR